ncbi:MAG: 50S ribosomal protein L33 [bacterium]
MRVLVILECPECRNRNYTTDKNKTNHSGRVVYKKYCPTCNKHTAHKETR